MEEQNINPEPTFIDAAISALETSNKLLNTYQSESTGVKQELIQKMIQANLQAIDMCMAEQAEEEQEFLPSDQAYVLMDTETYSEVLSILEEAKNTVAGNTFVLIQKALNIFKDGLYERII